jgi:prepilin-type processing-associated H-X9-DG protein
MAEQVEPIYCPRCNQPLYVRAYPGQLLNCRNCRSAFPAPRNVTAPAADATPSSAPRGSTAPPPQRPVSARTPPPVVSPGAPPAEYVPPPYRGGSRVSRMALWSLICGILFFFPLTALLAIIFGIIGLAKTNNPAVRGRGFAITGLVLGCVGLVFAIFSISILLPSLNRARETAHRVKCGANLRQIGQAMMLYANENRGQFPPTVNELLVTQDITPEVFVCPSSSDTPATGINAQQAIVNIAAGGHQSYIYLGKGGNSAVGRDVVLAYEPLSTHKVGFNALFGDGHVEFIYGPIAARVEAELKAGQNPPPSRKP